MIYHICLVLGLAVAVWALMGAIRLRYHFSLCVSQIMVGILLMVWIMVLPTYLEKNTPIPAFLNSMLYALKALGGRQDISQLDSIPFTGFLRQLYLGINYCAFFAGPLLTSSLLISFAGDIGERIRYRLSIAQECHVFSELNEHSLVLAQSISGKEKSVRLVFCNAKKPDDTLAHRARALNAVLLHGSAHSLPLLRRFSRICFYAVSPEDDRNIQTASAIIQRHRDDEKNRIELVALISSATNSAVVENIPRGHILLRVIDEISVYCCNLLLKNPLYDLPAGHEGVCVAIVGCGRQGMQLVKTAVWAGQLADLPLKICVFDKDEKAEKAFLSQCPELCPPEYDIHFYPSDATCTDFTELIKAHCPKATHVFLCMKDDDLNLDAAVMLRGFFIHCSKGESFAPHIFARVRTPLKNQNLLGSSTFLSQRSIRLFGSVEEIYAIDALINSEIEQLALSVHMCFGGEKVLKVANQIREDSKCTIDPGSEDYLPYQQALDSFYNKAYNRSSSMANALHIPAKLVAAGIIPPTEHALTEETAEAFLQMMYSDTGDNLVQKLGQLEHKRWNAFMRSCGYRGVDTEIMKRYAKQGQKKSHIHEIARLHPCITGWDQLKDVSTAYTEATGFQKDFQEEDYVAVRNIPMIIEHKGRF